MEITEMAKTCYASESMIYDYLNEYKMWYNIYVSYKWSQNKLKAWNC